MRKLKIITTLSLLFNSCALKHTNYESANFSEIQDEFPRFYNLDKTIPLFSEDSVLKLKLISDFPYRTSKNIPEEERVEHSGILEYDKNSQKISISVGIEARGSGRLSHCDFAPIKLLLKEGVSNSIFANGESDLKVVTHCDEGSLITEQSPEDTIMTELLLYKVLQSFRVYSFKVRPAEIEYVKLDGSLVTKKLAFFIEDKKDLAKRYDSLSKAVKDKDIKDIGIELDGLTEEEVKNKLKEKLNASNFIATYLAQVMILNGDWSGMLSGSNLKTFFDKSGKIARAHYDLDLSQLTGKFSRTSGDLRFEDFLYSLPPSLNSDLKIINDLCTQDSFPYDGKDKIPVCLNVLSAALKTKQNVLDTVNSFSLLPQSRKSKISERVEGFYLAMEKALTQLLE